MDPSNTIDWQWFDSLHGPTQTRVACILWTLYEHGPVVSGPGNAPSVLAELLRQRRGPYQARGDQPKVSQLITTITKACPELLIRDVKVSRTRRIALRPDIGPAELPPNPYAELAAAAPRRDEPDEPEAQMSASDALAAVASFVANAMRMAGVSEHDVTPDERLDEALADCRRLQATLDNQGEQLLVKMRENEVLRRALAQRNGALPKGR